ncbi:tRNA (cytidine(34)-2'-O)-methyltransferase [Kaustia mangrovi]|uniref:tRNA (cytidine(34)-2'-O)-methyltransferase n=1 Tax=Kaustia mangrovi TaxID=2593653 RepID=A0A7S8C6H9_9HYPH|nr:tRNA (cytidine(34)-2'-O)-methyltransferase [Kaustia mangrovi]QPC44300.1 tRNA (cytidine(34)-2'-O)-methyltransferase [Kaustia mangrovi]
MIEIALFQPDIPQNAGTIMRLGACLGLAVHVIEPAGFVWSEPRLRRAGMDYLDLAAVTRHASYEAFLAGLGERRLVLMTTRAETPYTDFAFSPGDAIMLGRESAGVPEAVHEAAAARLAIPMKPGLRSLNVAVACAMVMGEALRQTGGFPALTPPAAPPGPA